MKEGEGQGQKGRGEDRAWLMGTSQQRVKGTGVREGGADISS